MLVRPQNQLTQIGDRKRRHVDDGDPMITVAITRRFHTGNAREFGEAIRQYLDAESPFFGFAGFEVSKIPSVKRINENVARWQEQSLVRARQILTELFK